MAEPEPVQAKPKYSVQKKAKEEKKVEEEKPPAEGDMFKLKKKSSVTPRKPVQKEEEQPAFLVWIETLDSSEEPSIEPRDIIEAFFQICVDEVRNSGKGVAKMGG